MHVDNGTLFDWKEMNYWEPQKDMGTLMYITKWKIPIWKTAYAWLQLYNILEKDPEMWKLERLVVSRRGLWEVGWNK